MKLTKKQAIAECKEVWKLVADGKAKDKDAALKLLEESNPLLYEKIINYQDTCPLCECGGCDRCPYYEKYNLSCESYPNYNQNPLEFAQNIMKL